MTTSRPHEDVRCQREVTREARVVAWVHQNAGFPDTISFHPSEPCATSTRKGGLRGPVEAATDAPVCLHALGQRSALRAETVPASKKNATSNAVRLGNQRHSALVMQRVSIAKPSGGVPAQHAAASERWHQEVRHHVLVIQRGLHAARDTDRTHVSFSTGMCWTTFASRRLKLNVLSGSTNRCRVSP